MANPTIRVDHNYLHYQDGAHLLRLWVDWSFAPKTADHPCDFEVTATNIDHWTEPANEPIPPALQETILDEIAAYYSTGPVADIIGPNGALLRGQSKFRFSMQIPPTPSRYYEVGRFLSIPMAPPIRGSKLWHERYILDFANITHWTSPPGLPITPPELRAIADRIVRYQQIGVRGL